MDLLPETRAKILSLLKAHGALSVDEITRLSKLSKTNARQHLLNLEEQALIGRQYRKRGQGRPQLVFQINETRAAKLYPTSEPRMLADLLQHLIKAGNKELLEEFFSEFWDRRLATFRSRMAEERKSDYSTRVKVLRSLLEEEGFMPKIAQKEGAQVVKECNCPFRETVKVTKLPCALELQFLQQALEAQVIRLSYIPAGDPTCDYEARRKK